MQIPLIKGDSVDNSVDYRDSLPINMYAINKNILNSNSYMINFFGVESYADGKGVDRGSIWVSAEGFEGHYRVSGNSLISISSGGVVTDLGEISGSGQVSMAYSFNNLAIVGGGNLYYYNKQKGLREITDSDIGSPIDLVWVDGYFFLTDGKDIYHSDILNEEHFLPLDFSNAQFIPDASRGLGKNEDNEVVVFGEFSTEYFVNVGSNDFAFRRITQKAQKIGILGTHCKVEMEGLWYTLARRKETAPSFHIISLGNEKVISTRETDKVLSSYTPDELSSVTVDSMVIDNVKFIIFHLPKDTFLFNASIAATTGSQNAWTILRSGKLPLRAKNPILDPRNGEWVVGDNKSISIGKLSNDTFNQYGELQEWYLFTPFLKLETLSINKFEIETVPGVSPDNDAQVFISQTTDGRFYGQDWIQLYGDNLDYQQRFYIRGLGYCRNWVGYRLRGKSRSRMAFSNLDIEAS